MSDVERPWAHHYKRDFQAADGFVVKRTHDMSTRAAGVAEIVVTTIPRFKSSFFSGSEWRTTVRARVHFFNSRPSQDTFGYPDVAEACVLLGADVVRECKLRGADFARGGGFAVTFFKSGEAMHRAEFGSLAECLLCLAAERENVRWGGVEGKCDQESCDSFAVRFFELAHVHCKTCSVPAKHAFFRHWVRYCDAHAKRGDADFEDSDENLKEIGFDPSAIEALNKLPFFSD